MFKKISVRKFILAFSITLIATMLVAVGVYAAMRAFLQPPAVPTHVEVPLPPPSRPSGTGDNPSNTQRAPEDNTPEEDDSPVVLALVPRKPMFYTFLAFGIDNGNNADAIMVGAFDAQSGQAYLISIPRDTRVDTDRRLRKMVASYSAGRGRERDHDRGVQQMKDDVHSLLGFRPDFYVSVNFRGFIRLVDSLGGVEVNVPFHMQYTDPYQNLSINIPPGTRTLTGQQALHFARYREGDEGFRSITDFGRMENQQQILLALARELLSPRTIIRVPELIQNYRENVSTNLTNAAKIWFASQLTNISMESLSAYTLPIAYTRRQGWYEIPDEEGILELVNRTVNPFAQDITAEMLRIAQ